jgi:uncharacterized protein (TIGR01777 family)
MRIVIVGGTGFIGAAVSMQLAGEGHNVTVLSRSGVDMDNVKVIQWDPTHLGQWVQAIDGADAVVNLAGTNVAGKRWSTSRKKLIIDSRVETTSAMVRACEIVDNKPKVLVNISAVGYYGDVPEGDVTEYSPAGQGFLAELCKRWEENAERVQSQDIRCVVVRVGIVLGKGGGALQKMLLPFRFFLGGHLGSGRQGLPWIHMNDVTGALIFIIENEVISGPVNLVSPESVNMSQFCKTLARVMHRQSWLHVPGFALRMVLGEMSEMLLTGQRVVPKKLCDAKYPFRFTDLKSALENILIR